MPTLLTPPSSSAKWLWAALAALFGVPYLAYWFFQLLFRMFGVGVFDPGINGHPIPVDLIPFICPPVTLAAASMAILAWRRERRTN